MLLALPGLNQEQGQGRGGINGEAGVDAPIAALKRRIQSLDNGAALVRQGEVFARISDALNHARDRVMIVKDAADRFGRESCCRRSC